jgi:hypothetical protein
MADDTSPESFHDANQTILSPRILYLLHLQLHLRVIFLQVLLETVPRHRPYTSNDSCIR